MGSELAQGHLVTERPSRGEGVSRLFQVMFFPLHGSPRSPGVELPSGRGGIRIQGALEDVAFPTEVSVEGEGHRAFPWGPCKHGTVFPPTVGTDDQSSQCSLEMSPFLVQFAPSAQAGCRG